MRVLAVLPTFNEAENIQEMLRLVRAKVPSVDILVVDDGSPDGTGDLAAAQAVDLGQIEVIRRPGKGGLGSAYRLGFHYGLDRGYDVLISMDSDMSHDPDALPELLKCVSEGADLVIGSRYVPGGSIPDWPLIRRAISKSGNFYARTMLNLKVRDCTGGYRAFTRRVLEEIDLDSIRASGYGFQVELTYLIESNGRLIVETPICFRDRMLGHSKMSAQIMGEAFVLVTWWAFRDRVLRRKRHR